MTARPPLRAVPEHRCWFRQQHTIGCVMNGRNGLGCNCPTGSVCSICGSAAPQPADNAPAAAGATVRTFMCSGGCRSEVEAPFGPLPLTCRRCNPLVVRHKPAPSQPRLVRDVPQLLALQCTTLRVAVEQIRRAHGMGNLRLIGAVLDTVDAG